MKSRRPLVVFLSFFLACCMAWPAHAADDSWPARPIRLIITGGPASAPDIVGRIVAAKLSQLLGQQVVVEPMAAGGGIVGVQALTSRPADGYTLLLGTSTMLSVTPQLRKVPPYDVERDLEPIGMVGSTANVLVVSSSLPVKTLDEFIAYARARPGQLNYASTGVGTPAQLGAEALNQQAHLKLVHVPYKGSGQAMTDLASGQVQVIVTSPLAANSFVKSGKARMLATTGRTPDPHYPDLPPVASVLPGYELTQWFGLVVRRGTPERITQRISESLDEALKDPGLVKLLNAQSFVVAPSGPRQFAAYIGEQRAYFEKIIRAAGIAQE